MNSIWKRVQMRRQTETIAPNNFILQYKNQLKPCYSVHLLLLRRSWCKATRHAGKVQPAPVGFRFVICITEREESEKVLLKVTLNGERQNISLWLVCLKDKLNQQGGVDRNWIKPSGRPLQRMDSDFITLKVAIWAQFGPPPPPPPLK